MNDEQLLRYSRQIMLPQFDYAGQESLLSASVLIVGLGGLGSPVALYLAAAGVGELLLNDFDDVDASNLQRQVIHQENDIAKNKAVSAQQKIQQLNPSCQTQALTKKLDKIELDIYVKKVDAVVDCSDNFTSRYLLNQLCVKNKTPLISGAAIRFEGQISVFHNYQPDDACYRCLYPQSDADIENDNDNEALNCSENGVMSPVVGVIGSLQALETIKVLANIGQTLRNRLLLFDGLTQEYRNMKFKKDASCPVCSSAFV